MTTDDPRSNFDAWAPTYDRDVVDDGQFPFDGYGRVLDRLVELAAVSPGLPVLELGVGTGNLTRRLADEGGDVWGVDFSPAMLALADEKVPSANLAQADLTAPLPAAYRQPFPLIVSSYVFHEFPTDGKRALLQRLLETHLAPGGRILIGDIGFPDDAAREAVRAAAGERWEDEYFWLADEAVTLAADLGLAVAYEQLSSCAVVVAYTAPGSA